MPRMTRLLADVKAEFGDYVEVVPGWETRGSSSFAPGGTLCHWTAGPRSGDRPSLRICTYGRSDLPGPLCNVFLTRAGKPIIVAAGRANHAGRGEFAGLKGNSAWYGIEAESSGGNDWTDAQRRNYPRLVAALQRGIDRDERTVAGHSEYALPAGRKVDINGYPMSAMRASVAAGLAGSGTPGQGSAPLPNQPKEGNMAAADADRVIDEVHRTANNLMAEVKATLAQATSGQKAANVAARGVEELLGRPIAKVDAAEIAALIPDSLAQDVVDELVERLKGA